jgi:hypothetical protein
LAPGSSPTFLKRQKERARQEKQQAKQQRKMERRLEKKTSALDPQSTTNDLTDAPLITEDGSPSELHSAIEGTASTTVRNEIERNLE